METFFESNKVIVSKSAKSLSYFCTDKLVKINRDIIKQMVDISKENSCDMRLCLHNSPDDKQHSMLILHNKSKTYFRPHKHKDKSESYQMIEGKMNVFIFDEEGKIIDSQILSSENNFLYRIPENTYHATISLTDYVVFNEFKPGPFIREGNNIFPDWCPAENTKELETYFDSLIKTIQ